MANQAVQLVCCLQSNPAADSHTHPAANSHTCIMQQEGSTVNLAGIIDNNGGSTVKLPGWY